MNTQTIRLSSPVDLITSMPYMLGFHPQRSVVLVNLRGGRLGLTQHSWTRPNNARLQRRTAPLSH